MTDSICLRCNHKRYCETGVTQPSENSYVTGCSRFEPKPPQTNADKIRAMTDEEMACFLDQVQVDAFLFGQGLKDKLGREEDSASAWFDWLQQEADE